jgi:hypothetical protein
VERRLLGESERRKSARHDAKHRAHARALDKVADQEQERSRLEKALADYQAQASKPFDHEARMKELLAGQAQLNAALDLDKNETQVAPPAEDIEPVIDIPQDSKSVRLFSGALDELCTSKSRNDSDFGLFDFQLFFQSTAPLTPRRSGSFLQSTKLVCNRMAQRSDSR